MISVGITGLDKMGGMCDDYGTEGSLELNRVDGGILRN